MIREEKLGNVTDEEDFIRDDDSDPIAGMYSDSDKEENLASDVEDVGKEVARARSSHSDREENLPSDNEEERQRSRSSRARTLQARPTGTADSEKEHILPSDDEAEEKPKSSRAITSESNREDILPSDDDEPPPLGNPKITRRLTSQSSREETLASDGEFLDEEGTAAEAPKWSVPRTTDSDREENLPSDDEELNERERAAIKIQAATASPYCSLFRLCLDHKNTYVFDLHIVILKEFLEGAGIFIDYVLITENVVEGRQFVCYCSKWFDSGQVDGKIERILPVAAFYYLNSIPDESMTSRKPAHQLIGKAAQNM
ncbi:hypothetical protein ANCCEY_02178 [Ancylostoma ceylanicum]|uniref:Uncharacterized protein n=1 Tax=Ancylostoma ceylanicum TaxID=53326 RepID=A0A0D6M5P2_9BILA|nr:hypothetical protein ANCCEY_02178 [Ancylostoma ceylanicum]